MKNIKTISTRAIIPYFPWVPRHQAASAMMGATFAAAASPLPALAARVEEEDEGFDLRILAVPWRPSRMKGLSRKNGALMVMLWSFYGDLMWLNDDCERDLLGFNRSSIGLNDDFLGRDGDLTIIYIYIHIVYIVVLLDLIMKSNDPFGISCGSNGGVWLIWFPGGLLGLMGI